MSAEWRSADGDFYVAPAGECSVGSPCGPGVYVSSAEFGYEGYAPEDSGPVYRRLLSLARHGLSPLTVYGRVSSMLSVMQTTRVTAPLTGRE